MAAQAVASANVQAYLRRVDQLYADVRNWMTALEPNAQFSETEIELVEEATGPYKVRSLEVARQGRPAIRLIPRGHYMWVRSVLARWAPSNLSPLARPWTASGPTANSHA